MKINRKPTGRAMSIPGGLAVSAVVSVAITMACCVVLAKLITDGKLAMEYVGYGTMLLLLIASFAGSITAQSKIKCRKMQVSLISGAVYYGILLGITALFFGGQYAGFGTTGLVVLAGSGTAALVTAGKGTNRVRAGKQRVR